jgi:hypothetical protein
MKALWSIALSTTLLNGLATARAVASPAPRVTDLAPATLTRPQQQQVDHLRQRYRCPLDDRETAPAITSPISNAFF